MAYPDAYARLYDYQSYQNSNPTRPLPGNRVNADLNAVADFAGEVVAFIAGALRSDGALVNGVVTYESLSDSVQSNGLLPAEAWAGSTDYVVGNAVYYSGSMYRCAVDHTSSVFATDLAAAYWTLLVALPTGAAGTNGTDGADGISQGFKFTFNSATSGDPGSGQFLFDNATFASATAMNISETDGNSNGLAALFATLDDSTNTQKCVVHFVNSNGSAYFSAYITGTLTDNGGYDTFSVTPIGTSGSIANGDVFYLTAVPISDKGADGAGDLTSTNNLSDVAAAYTALDNLSVHGANIASAATVNLETATGFLVDVTGTTSITAITLSEGHQRVVRFTGALTLTHGASLVLPGAANITTAAGDYAIFVGYAAGVVRCVAYSKASGKPVLANTASEVGALSSSVTANLTVGFTATSYSAGTKSSGTFTPDPALGNIQHYTNGGAHTLAPPSSVCSMIIECTNSSAGVLTTSGFNIVSGDVYSSSGTKKHIFYITKTNSYSELNIRYVTGT